MGESNRWRKNTVGGWVFFPAVIDKVSCYVLFEKEIVAVFYYVSLTSP